MLKYGHRILLYYFAIFSPELKECYTIRSAENHWWYDIWLTLAICFAWYQLAVWYFCNLPQKFHHSNVYFYDGLAIIVTK